MTGLAAHPQSTLIDRTLEALADGPRPAAVLARDVFGLANAPDSVAARVAVALLGADPRVRQMPDGAWALAAAVGSPALDECAFAVIDVETTGGGRGRGQDRITEIAVVVVQGQRCHKVLDTLVNPECPIAPVATAITRITNDMVQQAPTFGEIADEVLGALSGRIFVAHNARFDWGIVSGEIRRARAMELTGPRICTVRLARRLVKELESCSLDAVSLYFGLENGARHRAGGDALVTAKLLSQLLGRAREQGVRTLRELEALAEAPLRSRRRKKRRR